MKPCYLDYNAGEPISEFVAQTLTELYATPLGNPNSLHPLGSKARREVNRARDVIARAIGTHPSGRVLLQEVVEIMTVLVHSVMSALGEGRRARIIYGATEHPSVRQPILDMDKQGLCKADELGVNSDGHPNLEQLRELAQDADSLFLMAANNETGVLHDMDAISQIVAASNIRWHCDAVQLLGKQRINFGSESWRSISSASVSAHKLGGPPGCGALILNSSTLPSMAAMPTKTTMDAIGIVGFAAATDGLERRLKQTGTIASLRDHLEEQLMERYPSSIIYGKTTSRLGNTSAISLKNSQGWADGEDLVLSLAEFGICVSTGAACSTGSGSPSHVLLAMGIAPEQASASLRISLGPETTKDDIELLIRSLGRVFPPPLECR